MALAGEHFHIWVLKQPQVWFLSRVHFVTQKLKQHGHHTQKWQGGLGVKFILPVKERWFLLSQFTAEPGDAHFLGIAHSHVLPLVLGSSEIAIKSGEKKISKTSKQQHPLPLEAELKELKGIMRVRDSSQLLKSFWSPRTRNKCHYLGSELLYFKVVIFSNKCTLRTQTVSAPCTNVQGVHSSELDPSEVPMNQDFWDEHLFCQGNSYFALFIKINWQTSGDSWLFGGCLVPKLQWSCFEISQEMNCLGK